MPATRISKSICADLVEFRRHTPRPVELVVCMVDTLLHLASQDVVEHLFDDVFAALEPGGTFIATFRDFSVAAEELDRFISVRSDERTIFTCFLEFEPAHRQGSRPRLSARRRRLGVRQELLPQAAFVDGVGRVDAARRRLPEGRDGLDRGLVVVTATK